MNQASPILSLSADAGSSSFLSREQEFRIGAAGVSAIEYMPIPIEEQLELLLLEVLVTESPSPLRRRHDPESGAALIDLS